MLFLYSKILIIFSFLISTSLVFAAQWATITKEKAVIYADQELTAPIGYIRRGKKIRVGEIARSYGKIIPVVVNGKVTYIKIQDIGLSGELAILETPTERIQNKAREKNHENLIALTYNGMATTFETADGDETVFFNGAGIRGYIIDLKKRRSWRVGSDFTTTTINDYQVDLFSITGEYAFNFVQTNI